MTAAFLLPFLFFGLISLLFSVAGFGLGAVRFGGLGLQHEEGGRPPAAQHQQGDRRDDEQQRDFLFLGRGGVALGDLAFGHGRQIGVGVGRRRTLLLAELEHARAPETLS